MTGALLGAGVIITADHDQGGWVCLVQGVSHLRQIACIKGTCSRAVCCLMHAGGRGVTFSHQQHRCPRRIADHVPKTRFTATALKQFIWPAAGWRFWGDALHVPQFAGGIAHWNQQRAIRCDPHTVRLHAFAGQVATVPSLAGSVPDCLGFIAGGRVACCGLLGFKPCQVGAFCGQLCCRYRIGRAGCLICHWQSETMFFGQVQQRADANTAILLDAAPS